jgi:hypothetical protein
MCKKLLTISQVPFIKEEEVKIYSKFDVCQWGFTDILNRVPIKIIFN